MACYRVSLTFTFYHFSWCADVIPKLEQVYGRPHLLPYVKTLRTVWENKTIMTTKYDQCNVRGVGSVISCDAAFWRHVYPTERHDTSTFCVREVWGSYLDPMSWDPSGFCSVPPCTFQDRNAHDLPTKSYQLWAYLNEHSRSQRSGNEVYVFSRRVQGLP
jgi:hypothetical protein